MANFCDATVSQILLQHLSSDHMLELPNIGQVSLISPLGQDIPQWLEVPNSPATSNGYSNCFVWEYAPPTVHSPTHGSLPERPMSYSSMNYSGTVWKRTKRTAEVEEIL